MTTIHDVARRAGVSITTVSRVINANPRVSAETRQKVEQAIQELGYVPNPSARSLILGRSHLIALVVPDIANPFYARLVKGVQSVCDAADISVLICSTDRDAAKERQAFARLARQMIDGICAVRYHVDDEAIRQVARSPIPLVVIGSRPEGLSVDSAGVFGTGAALRTLLAPLVRKNRRRVAFLAVTDKAIVGQVRMRIYHELVADLQLENDPRLIEYGDLSLEGGYDAANRLLATGVPFHALLATNDVMAVGAMRALEERGYRIPGDVAVIGCDDVDMAQVVKPALSTVRLPSFELGVQGAELLLNRIKHPEFPVRERALEARPIRRESTPGA